MDVWRFLYSRECRRNRTTNRIYYAYRHEFTENDFRIISFWTADSSYASSETIQVEWRLGCTRINIMEKCKINSQITTIFRFYIGFCILCESLWCRNQIQKSFFAKFKHDWENPIRVPRCSNLWALNFWTSGYQNRMKRCQYNIWGSNRDQKLSLVAGNVWVRSTDRFKLNCPKNLNFENHTIETKLLSMYAKSICIETISLLVMVSTIWIFWTVQLEPVSTPNLHITGNQTQFPVAVWTSNIVLAKFHPILITRSPKV